MNGENDTMYYVHKDYLGSYDVITDESGNVLERLSFDPWGRRRNATDWTFNNLSSNHLFNRGYTGHEHLDVFSLINMNGRVYDPWLGRFLSPDPFVQSPDYSQSYNRYSYCLNNPLKYSDPSGYCAWKFEPADYMATFGGGYGAGIFRINWNQNLAVPGSYSYDWNTGTYRNSKGEEVTWDEVNGFIANERITLTGVAAQSLYQNYTYGMNIYSISAFGRATLVSCFGELGPVEGSEVVGIYFNNPTAGAFIGETEVFDNMITDGGVDDIAAAGLGFGVAAYWGETVNTLYNIHESKNLAYNIARAQAYKSITGTIPKSMKTAISYGKTMTTVTNAVGRGLFVVGTAMTIYDMASDPTTENLILGSADLIMGVVSIGCPVVGLVYFSARIIYDIVSEE